MVASASDWFDAVVAALGDGGSGVAALGDGGSGVAALGDGGSGVAALGDGGSGVAALGEAGRRAARVRAFVGRVPVGYRERTTPADAAADVLGVEAVDRLEQEPDAPPETSWRFGGRHLLRVRPGAGGGEGFRLHRIGDANIELTAFLPVLESFGLTVVEAVPFALAPGAGGRPVFIDDFGVRPTSGARFDVADDGPRLVDAMKAVARRDCDVDSLNRLVVAAGLAWREVAVLRTYRRFRHQAAPTWSDDQLDDALVGFPSVAAALAAYFQARFDPVPTDGIRQGVAAEARRRVVDELGTVPHLEQDQVLRGYLGLVDATVRTNWYRRDVDGRPMPAIALKLQSGRIPELPAPRPLVETFVHAPEVDGVHLRAGIVARGGIRWSNRPDDFRTEVLDLAQAQVKKNAIIVPTGAKGGFVCRGGLPGSAPDVASAYRAFVTALLDITDNLEGGEVIRPSDVVALDGDDPYLVVAADRGTATFSDLANDISAAHHFWLGDAFASGGSLGYDHKAMGITARGAWVAVRRHFRQLGIDVQTEPVRVVGVGDMSGDVFGNGMLQSRKVCLVGAFDHRHVFIDPTPDPEVSFAERARLAALRRSSWADYDAALLSRGGGVWARDAKSILLSPDAQRALGTSAEELSPPEVISLLLAAPVDLLWFGGIGTYIKASGEPDTDVGDRANVAVRVTAEQVRARVIAEGANLGITPLARIRYSRRGGRINSDFVDNAAGVATSDREVNVKILLTRAIERGRLPAAARDALLASAEDDVAVEVLRQVDHSVGALDRALPESACELDSYEALLVHLESEGLADRAVDSLPDASELEVRRQAGAGWIRPELAALLAFAKSDLVAAIEASPVVRDPSLLDVVRPYFPPTIRERFDDLISGHRLYPQLVATSLAGELVDQLGPIWAYETGRELGRPLGEVAGAFWAARQVLDAGDLWIDLERAGPTMPADAESASHELLAGAVAALARQYLRAGAGTSPAVQIERDRPLVTGPTGVPMGEEVDRLVGLGVAGERAATIVGRCRLAAVGDAGAVSRASGAAIDGVLAAFAAMDGAAGLDALAARIRDLPAAGRSRSWVARTWGDDIADFRRRAVTAALAAGGPSESAIAEWAATRQPALARIGGFLADDDGWAGVALAVHALADAG